MTLKFRKLQFNVYEFETYKFVFNWLVENKIEFNVKIRQSEYDVPVFKVKIHLNRIKENISRKMLRDMVIETEELYEIQYVE